MKDRALALLAWLAVAGLLVGLVVALVAGALLLLRTGPWEPAPVDTADDGPTLAEPTSPTTQTATAGSPPTDATALPTSRPEADQVAPCAALPPPGPFERTAAFERDDAGPVDAVQLFAQAQALAADLEPESVLRYISADHVEAGTVDLAAHRISFVFEYQRFGPAGRETGLVEVQGRCAGLYAVARPNVDIYRHNQYDPVPAPACSMRDAWRAAVQSGLPPAAPVKMIYRDDDFMKAGSAIIWSVSRDDDPKHRRDVDGRTCRLYRTFQSGQPVLVAGDSE